ncbi:MAG: mercury transporter MerT [Rhodospirillaceae bacterium]|nr:MAG: mercury transporter MerT [Rhodospirillaceae bacterium]
MAQEKHRTWVAVGSVAGALGASTCCVLPLALFSLGIGGAWVGNLAVFAPYQSYFIAGTLPLLGYGFYLTYRNPKTTCAEDTACTYPLRQRLVPLALWTATALILAVVAFPALAPLLRSF